MTEAQTVEVNFDGLVGPTHNYAGLSHGNVASSSNAQAVSNPKQAALQGLKKMKTLSDMGLIQGVLPPHQRPDLAVLSDLGFKGEPEVVLAEVAAQAPHVLAAVISASNMWVANAATVSPSADTADGRVHFTPANLATMFHRSIEAETTGKILKSIFADDRHFAHHAALPCTPYFGDEGAANHTRLTAAYGDRGVELFIYGVQASGFAPRPVKYPARQTKEASEAIIRLHGLDESQYILAQQHPDAIDAGVFHNDVIAVGNGNVLFYHEKAFLNELELRKEITTKLLSSNPVFIRVTDDEVPLKDAVKSYVFNTQLIYAPGRAGTTIVAPFECQETQSVKELLDRMIADRDNPVSHVEFLDVRQSMRNGGGPACLRLRVVLTPEERHAIHARIFLTNALYEDLCHWVDLHYRDRLTFDDLADAQLWRDNMTALDELTTILNMPNVYSFQSV